MNSEAVLTRTHNRALVITINRPRVRNAVNLDVAKGLSMALNILQSRSDLAVGVVTGAEGTFCSGMDLKAFAAGEQVSLPHLGFAGFVEAFPEKPLIAAVEGYALAGGFEIALACDLIVASRTAKFGLPEVKRGLTAAAGGLMRLPMRLPYNRAMELVLTGRQMGAEEADRFGLLSGLVEPGEALTAALDLAEEIASNAPLAVAVSKQIVSRSRTWSDEEMFARQSPFVEKIARSADALEGAVAFAEKRSPIWRGS